MEKMMREIKFRRWCETWMDNTPSWIGLIDGEFSSECELMQYTGLTDKNGKEIYEGDIILHPSGRRYKVEIPSCYELVWTGEVKKIEVEGNIYENPELLENINDQF
jgi:hypothetical protein